MNDVDKFMNEEFEYTRQTAIQNAKNALEEAFVAKLNHDDNTVSANDIDEIISELENEEVVDIGKSRFLEQSESDSKYTSNFWKNIRKSLERPKYNPLQKRLQILAGILDETVVSVLTLPTGVRVEFTELPPWYDVVRYKICGFKYESLDL